MRIHHRQGKSCQLVDMGPFVKTSFLTIIAHSGSITTMGWPNKTRLVQHFVHTSYHDSTPSSPGPPLFPLDSLHKFPKFHRASSLMLLVRATPGAGAHLRAEQRPAETRMVGCQIRSIGIQCRSKSLVPPLPRCGAGVVWGSEQKILHVVSGDGTNILTSFLLTPSSPFRMIRPSLSVWYPRLIGGDGRPFSTKGSPRPMEAGVRRCRYQRSQEKNDNRHATRGTAQSVLISIWPPRPCLPKCSVCIYR